MVAIGYNKSHVVDVAICADIWSGMEQYIIWNNMEKYGGGTMNSLHIRE
jgi:hypothetical protein